MALGHSPQAPTDKGLGLERARLDERWLCAVLTLATLGTSYMPRRTAWPQMFPQYLSGWTSEDHSLLTET